MYEVLTRLTDHGIIKNLTNRRRNQIFGTPDILAELTDLDLRISSAAQFLI